MPLKAKPSQELLTLADANSIIAALKAKGVPVSNVREISSAYGVVSIDDPNYVDDQQPYQFIANIFGADQELGLVKQQLGEGGLTAFLKLAESAYEDANPQITYARAFEALINLPVVNSAIEAALKL